MASRTSETSTAKSDRSHVERDFASLDDLRLCLIVPFWLLLSWIMPQRGWPFVTRWLAGTTRSRKRLAHEDAIIARRLGTEAQQKDRPSIAIGYHAARIEHFFQILRDYRPGGWKPKIEIVGLEHVDDAMVNGKGGLLWVGHFAFNGLAPKMAMQRAGYPLSHLSRPEHGFSKTAFGIRVLNPIRARVEDRYLRRRILIERGRESVATRQLRECVIRGEIVSITAGAWEGRMVEQAGIFGSSMPLSTGAPSLARSTGAALLPLFAVRETDGDVLKIVIERPIEFGAHLSRDEARSHAVAEFAGRMEAWARKCPEQWRDWLYVAPELKYDRTGPREAEKISRQSVKDMLQQARTAGAEGDPQRGLDICGSVLETSPDSVGAKKLMAQLLGQLDRADEAIIMVDNLIAAQPKPNQLVPLLVLKSKLAFQTDNISGAEQACLLALELKGSDRWAQRQLVNLYAWSGQWEKLDGVATDLMDSPARNAEIVSLVVQNLTNAGRFDEASRWMQRIPETENANHFYASLKSKIYRRDRDEESATKALQLVNLGEQIPADRMRILAMDMHGIGMFEEASFLWARYLSADPTSYDARFGLAYHEVQSGKIGEAIGSIEQITKDPRDRGRSIVLIDSLLASEPKTGQGTVPAEARETLLGLRDAVVDTIPEASVVARLEKAKATLMEIRHAAPLSSTQPRLSLVCPIHRPTDLGNAVAQLMRQRGDNLETIIALHTTEIAKEDIADLWTVDRPVSVIDCTDCATIGAVLNRAIRESSGEIILKMDADDLYFPNYAVDMASSLYFHDAVAIGKKAKFRFFHEFGSLLLEYPHLMNKVADRGAQAGGTTICLRRSLFNEIQFQEKLRTAEDTVFYTQVTVAGHRTVFVDPFNHVAQRAVNRNHHSWRTDSQIMLLGGRNSTIVGDRAALSMVEV